MAKEVMRRRASDNEYFHRDFHGALSAAIEYLDRRFGEQAVREYLRRFTNAYYAPLKASLRRRGLAALKEHFEGIYRREGGEVEVACDGDELRIRVKSCPAVAHMRERGYLVARLFHQTTAAVNEALCEGSDFSSEMTGYDPASGACLVRFWRAGK